MFRQNFFKFASAANSKKSIYAPGTRHIASWMGVNWEHRWIFRKVMEGFVLWWIGDILSQYYILWRFRRVIDAKSKSMDGPSKLQTTMLRELTDDWSGIRSLRAGVFGLVIYTPLRMRWSQSLEKVLPFAARTSNAGTGKFLIAKEDYHILAKRLAFEYIAWLPSMIGVNFLWSSFCDGRPQDTFQKSGLVFLKAWKDSAFIFVPTQAFCFFVVPPWLWGPVTGTASVAWAASLSYHNFTAQQLILHGKIMPPLRYRVD